MKKYVKIEETKNVNYIKIELSYNLGGKNVWTGEEEARGYYIFLTPVKRDGCCESFEAFSGVKKLIKPVKRQSAKAQAEAEEAAALEEAVMLDYVCSKNRLKLAGE